jgi:hypothetical protein
LSWCCSRYGDLALERTFVSCGRLVGVDMVRVLVAMDASLEVEVFAVLRLSCRNIQLMLMVNELRTP